MDSDNPLSGGEGFGEEDTPQEGFSGTRKASQVYYGMVLCSCNFRVSEFEREKRGEKEEKKKFEEFKFEHNSLIGSLYTCVELHVDHILYSYCRHGH